jgi:hypothetical protein
LFQILALYEFSAHPDYDSAGIPPTLSLLDKIIHLLGLMSIDAQDADVCKFPPHAVPVLLVSTNNRLATKCSCIPPNAPHAPDGFTSWSYSVPWDSNWTSEMVCPTRVIPFWLSQLTFKVYQEECRRLCWIALGLVANYTAQCAALNRRAPELFLTDPSNVCDQALRSRDSYVSLFFLLSSGLYYSPAKLRTEHRLLIVLQILIHPKNLSGGFIAEACFFGYFVTVCSTMLLGRIKPSSPMKHGTSLSVYWTLSICTTAIWIQF